MSAVLRRRRRTAASLVVLLAVAAPVALLAKPDAQAQTAAGPVGVEAQIGPASGATLLGPATATGTPGEAWGFTDQQRTNVQPKTVDGQELATTKVYLVRYRPAEGWRYVQAPEDEQGAPYAGIFDAGRVTARGGLLLTGDDDTRPDGRKRVVLVRDATGPTRVVPAPGPAVVLPAAGADPAEELSPGVIAARATDDGRTEGFVAVGGRALQTGVARWDGTAWSRDPICVATDGTTAPDGCSDADTLRGSQAGLTAVALGTAEGGGAWLLARADDAAGQGLVLFRRSGDGTAARWRLRPLGNDRFSSAENPARGITAVRPLAGGHALTATPGGVWVDGTFREGGAVRSVTLHVTEQGTTSYCDGGSCDRPLGFDLRDDATSQAFDGPGDGTRVIGPVGRDTSRYGTFDGTTWSAPAAFKSITDGIAFSSLTEGWLGDVHVTRDRPASPLAAWSIPVRHPLTSVTSAPGARGDLATPALAVGMGGSILRYTPGQGWDGEVKLNPSGVARNDMRGVAWPTADTAFAVGDEGTMWRWRRVTGLWETDPATPYDFTGHLTGIAFDPADPERGFAVGRDGVLLRYGKSWEPMSLPAEAATSGPGGGRADLYGVAFAGSQALAAAGTAGVLTESGDGWKTDPGVTALLARLKGAGAVYAVAGLPDGGAVAVGTTGDNKGLVLERDSAGGAWRFSDQPLTGTAVAASAFRDGDRVRAVVSVSTRVWPTVDDLQVPPSDPASPAPRRQPFSLPVDGYLLRETPAGWRDEERTQLDAPTTERSRKSDPNLALLTDPAGRGWAIGGWTGGVDLLGRGDDPAPDAAETASVSRYDPAGPQTSSNVTVQAPAMDAGRARLLVGGHAQCAAVCADLAPIDTMPDRTLARAVQTAGTLGAIPTGPRAFVYTGGRVARTTATASAAEEQRYATLLAGGSLPVFAATSPGDASGGSTATFGGAFSGFQAPLGTGGAATGTTPVAIGNAAAAGRARTHYAVDVTTPEGVVRLVVIDNSAGSLLQSDPAGNPAEDQSSWLDAVLADAKAKGVAVVVSGSRSLNPRDTGAATDGTKVAVQLRDGGASAYVYDGAGVQRRGTIPFASDDTIPTFASGSLGYRAQDDVEGRGVPGLLLLELDLTKRDATSNRAPAAVRLIPVIDDLAIDAVDGRLLNRSQPALFQGLGRRPRSGGNWVQGGSTGGGEGNGADPYVTLPSPLCVGQQRADCATSRIDPEATFHSSDPDIADFVRVDPASSNPRKPFVDPATDKPVPDPTSGLMCPFNAGTTTISIESGGLRYQTTVTVRAGSALRPCGTVALAASRFPAAAPPSTAPATPPGPSSPPATSNPTVDVPIPQVLSPAPPAPVTPAVSTPAVPPAPAAKPSVALPPAPLFVQPTLAPPLALPPPPAAGSPAPPPGTSGASINVPVSQPVTQAERQKDEEVAEESSKAYMQYDAVASDRHSAGPGQGAAVVALVLIAAVGGGTALGTRRRRNHPYDYARATSRDDRRTR
ncbi:hypothetical protein [Patulibacter minatonensis]|uniref:hypothetical protein n=1 Tax=Patulibacter minatonensis TaxID=298163 RepID=UPI00047D93B1|nr:hypothetical protein [Patulibacter minatonensis]